MVQLLPGRAYPKRKEGARRKRGAGHWRFLIWDWRLGRTTLRCGTTFPEDDGRPFFCATYFLPRKEARYGETIGNAICLCDEHYLRRFRDVAASRERIWVMAIWFNPSKRSGWGRP